MLLNTELIDGKIMLIEARDFVYDLFKNIDNELFDNLMKASINNDFEVMQIIDKKLELNKQSFLVRDLITNFAILYRLLRLKLCSLIELTTEDERERITIFDMDEKYIEKQIETDIIKGIFLLLLENAAVKEKNTDDGYELYIASNLNEIKAVFEKVFKNVDIRYYDMIRDMLAIHENYYFDEIIPDRSFFYKR